MLRYKLTKDVKQPVRGTDKSAGIDFFVPNDFNGGKPKVVSPGKAINIASGVRVDIPKGYALIAFNKSGVALKRGLTVGACVIDEDYQGEVHLHLINTSNYDVSITPGYKLVQFLLMPVSYAEPVEVPQDERLFESETERGGGGFGSTGN